ncbi:histidine phosphatase family protein [Mycobacterium sp.]|uniref:histidine phosphatase family protein n=1 Tax=Mycobacterium sp. TaxID=1785 RepID=UPI0025D3C081|nr:histidine phosphatase family protein [Mycobacterium sp.]
MASVAVGLALVGAGVIAVIPATSSFSDARGADVVLTAGEEDIVLDLVRHGKTVSTGVVAGNFLPGSPLSALGQQEATEVGHQLASQLGSPDAVAGIFEGQNIRMAETAAPFVALEQETPQVFSGLNEIGGGIYAGDPYSGPGGILYDLTLLTWAFGYEFVPMPGSLDFNGIAFEDYFSNAVATMYADALANPIVSATGQVTDVAFSGEAAISTWTLLNAKNPDLAIFLPRFVEAVLSPEEHPFLFNAGVVELEGNPTQGWTLVSFDGQAIPQDPGLLTQLIVDFRDLITPPQTAAYNLVEAALTGDPTTIRDALTAGVQSVGAALVQYPVSVIDDIASVVQTLGADVAAGDSAATLADAFGSLVLGLP